MHRPLSTGAVRVAAGSVVVDEHNVLQDDCPIKPQVSNLYDRRREKPRTEIMLMIIELCQMGV